MKKITFLLFLLAQFFAGYTQESKPGRGAIEFVSKELSKLIKEDAKVAIIADGLQFTEGPLWVEKGKMLLLEGRYLKRSGAI